MIDSPEYALLQQQQIAQRQAEIRQMRLFATGLLGVMLVIFIITSIFEPDLPWLGYPRVFAESAMVGACADWFAVVALFRHPLGLPIPHTAIVPRHKKQVAAAFGEFISQNFLAPTVITARLKSIDAAGWIARWLKEPENTQLVSNRLPNLLPLVLDLLHEEQIHAFSRSLIHKGIDSIAAGPLAGRVLGVLVEHGQGDAAFDLAIETAHGFLIDHRQGVRERFAQGSVRWLPSWVDTKLADAFLSELTTSLVEARAPNHPWRGEFGAWISKLTHRLAHDAEVIELCERIKADVLHNSVVDGYLDWLGSEVENKVQSELSAKDGLLSRGLEHALLVIGTWLDNDQRIRELMNDWAQQLVLTTIVPNREEIGQFVTEVVERWDTKTLVDKLELRVGKDLQYIRVNGTLVGGLVGTVIFTLTKAFLH